MIEWILKNLTSFFKSFQNYKTWLKKIVYWVGISPLFCGENLTYLSATHFVENVNKHNWFAMVFIVLKSWILKRNNYLKVTEFRKDFLVYSNSPKKTNEQIHCSIDNEFVCLFFGRIQGYQKSFQNYLTFSKVQLFWEGHKNLPNLPSSSWFWR